MFQIAWTFNIFIHVPYYAGLLHMLEFLLAQKSYVDFCYKPSGQFFNTIRGCIFKDGSPRLIRVGALYLCKPGS